MTQTSTFFSDPWFRHNLSSPTFQGDFKFMPNILNIQHNICGKGDAFVQDLNHLWLREGIKKIYGVLVSVLPHPPQKMDQSVNVPGKNHILVFCLELNLSFTHGHIKKYVCLAFSYLAQIGQFLAPADRWLPNQVWMPFVALRLFCLVYKKINFQRRFEQCLKTAMLV